MPLFEGKTPQERNKTIAAVALGVLALLFLGRMFFGSTTPKKPTGTPGRSVAQGGKAAPASAQDDAMQIPQPVPTIVPAAYEAADGGRNIFAFYEPPVKAANTPAPTATPTPTPTPTPPLTLSSLAPNNVFAQTGDFTLTVGGDKFTPQARVYVDGQEVQTTFVSAQQLSAGVPGTLIGAPGTRTVVVRTPDGQLYSNPFTFNVADPPRPQYTYIGLLGGARYNDKAMLKPPASGGTISVQRGDQNLRMKDMATVQRGDVLDGRFRVTGISERAVDFVDTQLKVKHTIPYAEARAGSLPIGSRPTGPQPPRNGDDDDEP